MGIPSAYVTTLGTLGLSLTAAHASPWVGQGPLTVVVASTVVFEVVGPVCPRFAVERMAEVV